MATTVDDIRGWLKNAKEEGATHMLVVVDTFDHEDYPVNVKPGQNVRDVFSEYNGKNMQRVMEVYALHVDAEKQLGTGRNFNFEYPKTNGSKAPLVTVRKDNKPPIMKEKLSSRELFDVNGIINHITDKDQLKTILNTVNSRLLFLEKGKKSR